LRKNEPTLIYGKFELVDKNNPAIFAYTRELNGKKLLILLNFTSKNASAKNGINIKGAKILINNYATSSKSEELRPYEAVIYQL
jgi:oligo-1,6-glucosidase